MMDKFARVWEFKILVIDNHPVTKNRKPRHYRADSTEPP
jgi:hypothetical protein